MCLCAHACVKLCAHTFCMQLHCFDMLSCVDLRMRASSSSWGSSPTSFLTRNTCHHVFFFFLYISFVSKVNNLTQHWYTWDHAACMCMANPMWSTPGLIVPMCAGELGGVRLSQVICLIFWLSIFICIVVLVYSIPICILYCLFNYIHTFHHHCYVNPCHHILFI